MNRFFEVTVAEEVEGVEEVEEVEEASHREAILTTAARLIANDRQQVYGTPYQNFGRIAQLWSVILGRAVSRAEVALCMDAVKTARLIQTPEDEDGWIDKCGYSAIGGELSAL